MILTPTFRTFCLNFSRDISAYVIQSNVNEYGDSRITGPLKSLSKDLVKVKGGINHYYVIGELFFNEREIRKKFDNDLYLLRSNITSKSYFDDIKEYRKNNSVEKLKWKTSSAGNCTQIVDDEDNSPFDW